MRRGWTKAWRKELDSAIWKMPPLYIKVWLYLRHKANHSTTLMPLPSGFGMWVSEGMLLTSLDRIAQDVSYFKHRKLEIPHKQTIKKILNYLEQSGMVTRISDGNGTVISINNWHIYQQVTTDKMTANSDGKSDAPSPSPSPTSSPLLNNYKECSKNDEELKDFSKGIRDKGALVDTSCAPLSFKVYKKAYNVEEDTANSIELFLDTYASVFGEPHSHLRPEQWRFHVDTFMHCFGDIGDSHDLTLEDHEAMIPAYFNTEFENCDYKIHHYNTDGIKLRRFYEEAY